MKVTLDIKEKIICGFVCGVEHTNTGVQLVCYQLGSDDLVDGNTVKLPRGENNG